MNTNTLNTTSCVANETSPSDTSCPDQQAIIRELGELELICVGGGSGDVIF